MQTKKRRDIFIYFLFVTVSYLQDYNLKGTKNFSNRFGKVGALHKRPGGGLGSVLGKLGKKPKLSTLVRLICGWPGILHMVENVLNWSKLQLLALLVSKT